MKRFLFVLLSALFVFSCASKKGVATKSDLPDWVLKPMVSEDVIYGVGYAKMDRIDKSRSISITRAKKDIASQLESQIKSATIDYYQEAGIKQDTQALSFVEEITKEIVDKKLVNVRNAQTYVDKEGGFWSLVSFRFDDVKKAYEDEVAAAFQRSESAAFSEFKAKEALKFLDDQLKNSPTKSNPVKE